MFCFVFNIALAGCDYQNVQNECFCRPDLQTDADAFLQRCVNSACAQSTLDTNSATSIYDAYCTGAGFLRSTSSTPTLGSSTSSSTTLPIPSSSSFQSQQTLQTSQTSSSKTSNSVEDPSSTTNTSETRDPTPTDSTSGGNSDEGGNSLGTSDIIGIVFGIAGFIVTAIGTFFAWKAIKNKKSTRNSAHMEMM
ncbi:hypothetical protein GGS24DRAFT_287183 [Hypoxylon argillaceum]|nr:hypothetical protein GGS24DRAFT_287183 [Hypoxylon argillaceum]